jgi:hypothetical protein
LASLLTVTTAYALGFTGMTVLRFPGWLFGYFAALCAVVGLAQSVWVPRYHPRIVSILAGLSWNVLLLGGALVASESLADWAWRLPMHVQFSSLFWLLCGNLLLSAGLGYLSGVLVAGTFLVADRLRGILPTGTPRQDCHQQLQQGSSSPWDE